MARRARAVAVPTPLIVAHSRRVPRRTWLACVVSALRSWVTSITTDGVGCSTSVGAVRAQFYISYSKLHSTSTSDLTTRWVPPVMAATLSRPPPPAAGPNPVGESEKKSTVWTGMLSPLAEATDKSSVLSHPPSPRKKTASGSIAKHSARARASAPFCPAGAKLLIADSMSAIFTEVAGSSEGPSGVLQVSSKVTMPNAGTDEAVVKPPRPQSCAR